MTRHPNVTRDYPVTSRVSHATTTTPHHTTPVSWAEVACGDRDFSCIASNGHLGRASCNAERTNR